VKLREPLLTRRSRRRRDHPAIERDKPPTTARNDAVAGVCKSRIDPKHDHLSA
jgi:hypothetical protein